MAVSIPGVLLSSLMFEMKNSPGDTVGILLGTTLRYSVSTISDTESSGTREECKICVQEYVIADRGIASFTDRRRKVDFDKLEEMLSGKLEDVVGWFRYRCNSTHHMSLIEKTTHRCLKEGLPGNGSGKDLVFGLFTEQTPEDPGLHTLEHSFWHWIGSAPQLVHVDIVNLKSTSTMPYRLTPIAPPPLSLETYHGLLNTNRQPGLLTENEESVHAVAMNKLLVEFQEIFDPLKDELLQSFNTIQSLEEDIDAINKKLKQARKPKEATSAISTTDIDDSTNTDSVPPLISFNDDEGIDTTTGPLLSHAAIVTGIQTSTDHCSNTTYTSTLQTADILLTNGVILDQEQSLPLITLVPNTEPTLVPDTEPRQN